MNDDSTRPAGGGSNNWVNAGSRTQSGKPLLASDPHLAPSAPPPWHLIHVRTPEWQAAGAILTGSPGFAIGHNGFCAWGITAGLTDNTDLYLETPGPDSKSVREADGSFAPCEIVRETIRVKGQPDEITTQPKPLQDWKVEGKAIRKDFVFQDFPEAVLFVSALVPEVDVAGGRIVIDDKPGLLVEP